jgi:phospho-N-acetylmuramoyl-pentapeptide-transferase
MLYDLLQYLDELNVKGAGLYKFISFRAGIALILSLLISMVFGGKIIKYLKRLQIGETVRDLGLEGQKEKEGTPTMGGVIIIMSILLPCLLMADLENDYIILMLVATTWMGLVGFADDYIKVFKKDKDGLSGKFKILGQVGLGIIVALTMLFSDQVVVRMSVEEWETRDLSEEVVVYIKDDVVVRGEKTEMYYVKTTLTNVPFFKDNKLDYGRIVPFVGDNWEKFAWIIFVPVVILIVTAVSNGANLTDGIDGLATGVSAIIGATLGVLAYVSSNSIAAEYLNIMYLPGANELVVFAACFMGACIGFLWYNSYPAQIFMGDTGSLMIGGVIASLAILIRKELLIPILCGVFLVENLSVMMQVSYFKYTRKKYGEGRRIFLMSPLHHHFQKKGMHESKIVTRFWIVGILLAVLTIITLKIR